MIQESAETVSHWIVNRDTGWGCDGCDWTGKNLEEFQQTHGRPDNDNIPF